MPAPGGAAYTRAVPRVAILDDYQSVALSFADWSGVAERFEIEVRSEHIADLDELVDALAGVSVIVAMRERTPFAASTLARLPALELLVTTGMANASIDLAAAAAQGIMVCGTGYTGSAMPELTIGMIIALLRSFAAEDAAVRAGRWQHTIGVGLAGRTLGVLGLGRLGAPVARLAQAFGMEVIAWSPNLTAERASEEGARAVSKEELFAQSDVVTIHMPLSDRSRGIVGAAELALMRPSAYLINTSRGPLVDEGALVDALAAGRIAGAGLDVYDTEPLPLGHPLRTMPRTLLLPHIGYVTGDAYEVFYRDAVADILAWADGKPIRVLNG